MLNGSDDEHSTCKLEGMRKVVAFLALAALVRGSSARIDTASPIEKSVIDLIECDSIKNDRHQKNVDGKNLHFQWYNTRTNKETTVDLEQAPDVFRKEYDFKQNDPIYVFVPGFNTNTHVPDVVFIKNGITKLKNVNFILMDTSFYMEHRNETLGDGVLKAVTNIYGIGYVLGNFLAAFIKSGVQLDKLHVFGHSFGAQIVGYAARQVYHVNSKKLKRISGIDPGGICFDELNIADQISSNDADYVDIYHSNKGVVGTENSFGTANFFINSGGPQQPSCPGIPVLSQQCSHVDNSVNFWVESALHPEKFKAQQCGSYDHWQNGKCKGLPEVQAGFFSEPCNGDYYIKFEFNYILEIISNVKTRFVEFWNTLTSTLE